MKELIISGFHDFVGPKPVWSTAQRNRCEFRLVRTILKGCCAIYICLYMCVVSRRDDANDFCCNLLSINKPLLHKTNLVACLLWRILLNAELMTDLDVYVNAEFFKMRSRVHNQISHAFCGLFQIFTGLGQNFTGVKMHLWNGWKSNATSITGCFDSYAI